MENDMLVTASYEISFISSLRLRETTPSPAADISIVFYLAHIYDCILDLESEVTDTFV